MIGTISTQHAALSVENFAAYAAIHAVFSTVLPNLRGWNTACNAVEAMRTTLGQLVSELVDQYERLYHDHELATVAASVTLEEVLNANERRSRSDAPTLRVRRMR